MASLQPIADNPGVEPEIRYTTTADGVSIAYYTMGDGPPMVLASNILYNNLNVESGALREQLRSSVSMTTP